MDCLEVVFVYVLKLLDIFGLRDVLDMGITLLIALIVVLDRPRSANSMIKGSPQVE